MLWIALLMAASVGVAGYAGHASRQAAAIPQLQHRPGTPIEVVRSCREAAITAARAHAAEIGVELVRVDATSAGPMRRAGTARVAPVEIGVVYTTPSGQEASQGVVQCRVDRRGRAAITDVAAAAR